MALGVHSNNEKTWTLPESLFLVNYYDHMI